MNCRFIEKGCTAPAVYHVVMDKGCVCFREDRDQWLCAQHEHQGEPLGSWQVVEFIGKDGAVHAIEPDGVHTAGRVPQES